MEMLFNQPPRQNNSRSLVDWILVAPDFSQSISNLCYIQNPAKMMNLLEPSKDDDSSGEGVAVGSSKLTRSKKNLRRRQLVPTYNASTPVTMLANIQD
jgi:hypothetical protein